MSVVRTIVGLIAIGSSAACAGFWRHDVEDCAKLATDQWTPFQDESQLPALAGRYDLIIISETPRDFNKSIHGPLELWPTDSARRFSTVQAINGTRAVDRGVLWGAANLPSRGIDVPWGNDPSSRAPDKPGVVVFASGAVGLGPTLPPQAVLDGTSAALHIERIGRRGFDGTWSGSHGIVRVSDGHGGEEPEPHGRFCALRR